MNKYRTRWNAQRQSETVPEFEAHEVAGMTEGTDGGESRAAVATTIRQR